MTNINTLTYGDDISVLVAKLPANVQHALMQRTFSHIMGNEAAAVRTRLMTGTDTTEPLSESEADEAVAKWRQEKLDAMLEGKFSLRVVGPRLTPDETMLRQIARDSIIAQAKEAKVALPKASEKEVWEQAIDDYLADPKLGKAAQAELERRKAFSAPKADVSSLFKTKAA